MRMTLFPPPEETIAGTAEAIRSGRRSCLDVLEACLARIDDRELSVRAWVVVDREGALEQARDLDDDRAADDPRRDLAGIPIGIKYIIDVVGLPTAFGIPGSAGRVARNDAEIVSALRSRGAVILGKTISTPYAWIDPPPTRNPWNLDHTPGGSSSGSAAALACGMCLGAIGTQTGGSITRPAAYCGVTGFKPTYASASLRGVLPLAPSLDHIGPLARTVGDLALLWGISAPDRFDSVHGNDTLPRIGRLRGVLDDQVEPVMRLALDRALNSLAKAGATINEPSLPEGFDDLHHNHRTIMAAEAASFHAPLLAEQPDDYPPRIRALVEEGNALSASDYIRARDHQRLMIEEVFSCFDDADVLATPAAPGPAPGASTTGDPACNSPWSYTGLPTITFPIGLSPDGLPMGIQLIGRPTREGEHALFATALWCESVIQENHHHHQKPENGQTRT
ncbi:amidase [soil metagenome]